VKKRQNKQTQQIKKIFIIALCFFENIEELILSVKQRNSGMGAIFHGQFGTRGIAQYDEA